MSPQPHLQTEQHSLVSHAFLSSLRNIFYLIHIMKFVSDVFNYFYGEKPFETSVRNVVFIMRFFSPNKKTRGVNETCVFSWQSFMLKSPPFLTKTLIGEFAARCTCPGYEQSSLFLLLFCQWHLLCALVCVSVSVLHFVLLLHWVPMWSRAGPEAGHCCKARESSGVGRTLQPLTKLSGCFGFGKRKSLECVWEKVPGVWSSARGPMAVSCGSPVCLHLSFPCGARVNPKFPRLEIVNHPY